MYRYVAARLITLNVITLSIAFGYRSANAQYPVFVDLNQSRQFFNEGNKIMERQIKLLQQKQKLPQIKLPEQHS